MGACGRQGLWGMMQGVVLARGADGGACRVVVQGLQGVMQVVVHGGGACMGVVQVQVLVVHVVVLVVMLAWG